MPCGVRVFGGLGGERRRVFELSLSQGDPARDREEQVGALVHAQVDRLGRELGGPVGIVARERTGKSSEGDRPEPHLPRM